MVKMFRKKLQRIDLNAPAGDVDLMTNPSARLPVCLCLDVSGSMYGQPIRALNEGVQLYYNEMNATPDLRRSVDTAVVSFGNDVKVRRKLCQHEHLPCRPCTQSQWHDAYGKGRGTCP